MMRFRSLENRFYRLVRDPRAGSAGQREIVPWQVGRLSNASYCLLTTFRADGIPVGTPMWFAVTADCVYLRSEAGDAKVGRIARNPEVLVTACTVRGRPTGPSMRGQARLITAPADVDRAEWALSANYGLERRLYGVTRATLLNAAYIEVRGRS
jgi:PPOX class probable F420-dependent enzyme